MLRIIITSLELKGTGSGRRQRARVKVLDFHGNKVWRDCWLPVDRETGSNQPGVYELSDRSFYVERSNKEIQLFPRLRFVRSLEALPPVSDGQSVEAVAFCNSP